MRIGAVVPHFRAGRTALPVLWRALEEGVEHLVVVDDASGDGTPAEIVAGCPSVELVARHVNGGYGAAVNTGLADLGGEYDAMLVLTQDCLLVPGALAALAARLDADPSVGLVGPLLLDPGGARVWSAGGLLRRPGLRPRHEAAGDPRRPSGDTGSAVGTPVDWLDGAALLLRPAVVAALGPHPFREDYYLYVEDVDLALRVRRAGWDVECVPAARAVQSTNGVPPYLIGRNCVLLARHHGRAVTVATTVTWQLCAAAREVALRRRAGGAAAGRARAVGVRDGLRGRLDRTRAAIPAVARRARG